MCEYVQNWWLFEKNTRYIIDRFIGSEVLSNFLHVTCLYQHVLSSRHPIVQIFGFKCVSICGDLWCTELSMRLQRGEN